MTGMTLLLLLDVGDDDDVALADDDEDEEAAIRCERLVSLSSHEDSEWLGVGLPVAPSRKQDDSRCLLR